MISEKNLLSALGEVDSKYIEEAEPGKKAKGKRSIWKWLSAAACFALVAVIGIGVLQVGWLGGKTDTAILKNGDSINFVRFQNASTEQTDIDIDCTIRELTGEEITALFGDLPVTAYGYFSNRDLLFALQGEIGKIKLIVSLSDSPIRDTVVDGYEKNSEVNGVPITAGYFLTGPNGKGIRTAIYYASFELGENTFYVESAGSEKESGAVRDEVAEVIQKLIANGEFDLSGIVK